MIETRVGKHIPVERGDYESVSTGDPRWWNAVCWERSELVKEGLMRDDSSRGVWEISGAGKTLPASLHKLMRGGDYKMISEPTATLEEVVQTYRDHRLFKSMYSIMVGDVVFQEPSEIKRI
jgi:Mrr N-terminal domain